MQGKREATLSFTTTEEIKKEIEKRADQHYLPRSSYLHEFVKRALEAGIKL